MVATIHSRIFSLYQRRQCCRLFSRLTTLFKFEYKKNTFIKRNLNTDWKQNKDSISDHFSLFHFANLFSFLTTINFCYVLNNYFVFFLLVDGLHCFFSIAYFSLSIPFIYNPFFFNLFYFNKECFIQSVFSYSFAIYFLFFLSLFPFHNFSSRLSITQISFFCFLFHILFIFYLYFFSFSFPCLIFLPSIVFLCFLSLCNVRNDSSFARSFLMY